MTHKNDHNDVNLITCNDNNIRLSKNMQQKFVFLHDKSENAFVFFISFFCKKNSINFILTYIHEYNKKRKRYPFYYLASNAIFKGLLLSSYVNGLYLRVTQIYTLLMIMYNDNNSMLCINIRQKILLFYDKD